MTNEPRPNGRPSPGPTVFVLFGATGDLARRLVMPALFRLAQVGLMPEDWRLVGNGRGHVSHDDFRQRVRESLEEFGPKPSEGPWDEFSSKLRFAGGGFSADDPGSLLEVLRDVESELGGSPQRVHYLAVPPSAFVPLTEGLGRHGLAERARVVYEKPFGTSLRSFEELDAIAHQVFDEQQIYRIDHFLGKQATQAIHVARFANGLFARAWGNHQIESVQVDVPETLDVGMRAQFYDSTGAILDMLVTHLFQLAAEVAMQTPRSLEPEPIARAREHVIGCFRPLSWDDVVVGQYDGYREIEGVPAGSRTETFVAARMWIDDERWEGVPFLFRTGKCMAESHQRVSIRFREPAEQMPGWACDCNVLGFELSGDGEIELSLVTKKPGPGFELVQGSAKLDLGAFSDGLNLPAYSSLIHDVLLGDRSLFTRPDGLRHVWEVAGALLENKPEPLPYEKGSWGPEQAAELAGAGGWILGE
jgi:glucose-6-phosphate 1-dehydrogenase